MDLCSDLNYFVFGKDDFIVYLGINVSTPLYTLQMHILNLLTTNVSMFISSTDVLRLRGQGDNCLVALPGIAVCCHPATVSCSSGY